MCDFLLPCSTSLYLNDWLTNWLIDWLTDKLWNTILFRKLIIPHLVKKFTSFYGIQTFITILRWVHISSLAWAISMKSIPSHHISKIHLSVFLPSVVSFLWVSPPNLCVHFSSPPYMPHAPPIIPVMFNFLADSLYSRESHMQTLEVW